MGKRKLSADELFWHNEHLKVLREMFPVPKDKDDRKVIHYVWRPRKLGSRASVLGLYAVHKGELEFLTGRVAVVCGFKRHFAWHDGIIANDADEVIHTLSYVLHGWPTDKPWVEKSPTHWNSPHVLRPGFTLVGRSL